MSTLALMPGAWGGRSTLSIDLPHPWRDRLTALTGLDAPRKIASYLTAAPQKEIRRLAKLQDDWDGNGSAAARPSSVAQALLQLETICEMAMAAGNWDSPHISLSETGEITFEWWSGERKITLYFDSDGMQVVRSWGPDLVNDMDLEQIHSSLGLASAWAWLNGN